LGGRGEGGVRGRGETDGKLHSEGKYSNSLLTNVPTDHNVIPI